MGQQPQASPSNLHRGFVPENATPCRSFHVLVGPITSSRRGTLLIIACSLFLQREGAEDILDFWLDVQQHENLCRAYFKDVRKSGRTIKDDWPQYWEYARRRGSIYGTVVGLNPETKRSTASTAEMVSELDRRNLAASGGEEFGRRSTSPRPPENRSAAASPEDNPPRSTTPFSISRHTPTLFNLKRASRAPTVIPRSSAISRMDLVASAERIFYRYLSPTGNPVDSQENHEIYLPPALRIHTFPLSSQHDPKTPGELSMMAQIPDMFHAQKEYCYRAMEQDAFPRFLRSKAFGNLTPISALARLILGLIILWIGLAVGFALIFLDVHPKSKRFFVSFGSPFPSLPRVAYVIFYSCLTALPPIRVCCSFPCLASV